MVVVCPASSLKLQLSTATVQTPVDVATSNHPEICQPSGTAPEVVGLAIFLSKVLY